MKRLITTSIAVHIGLLAILFMLLSGLCWFGICEFLMHWIDLSHGVGLMVLLAFTSITSGTVVLMIIRRKLLLPIKVIQEYNSRLLTECTAENCPVTMIPTSLIPEDEIGELMKSRNRMLGQLSQVLEERKQHYETIKKLEKLKDDLFHMIVHDLKSPLSIISLSLDMLERNKGITTDKDKLFHYARKGTGEVQRMIQNLLDISKLEDGKFLLSKSLVELKQYVGLIIKEIQLNGILENRSLQFVSNSDELKVWIDCDSIERILTNLISNAVKHTSQNGQIEIHVEENTLRENIRIVVKDDGEGIAPEFHTKIFEKFEQVQLKDRKAGTGLGLAFCKLAVEAHGGKIWVESEVGSGSKFILELPSHDPLQLTPNTELVTELSDVQ